MEEAADSCQGRLARLVCWLGPFEGPQLGEQGQVIREEDCRSGAGSPETSAEHRWEAPADQHWPDSHGGSSLDLSREAERVAMDIAALVASSSENEEVAAADLPQQDAPESALKDPFSLPQAPSPVRSRLLRGAVSPERPPAKRGGASFTSDVGSSPLGQAAGKDRLLRHRPIGRHRHTHSAGDTRHGFLMPGFGSTPETQRRLAPGNTQRPRSPSPTRGAPFGYTVDSPASTPGRMTPRATQTVAAKGRAGPSSAVQGHQAENRQSPTAKELLNTSMDAGLDMLKVWTALYEGSDEEQQYEDHIHVHLHTSFDDSLVLAPPASPRRPAGPLMGPHEQAVSSGAPGRSEGLALSQHEEMASHWSLSSEGRELSQLSQQLLDLGAEEGGASWASPTQSLETSKSRMSVESSVDLSAVIRHTTDPAPPQRQHPTSAASVGFPMLPWSLQEGESLSQVLQRSLSWRNVRKSEGGSSLRPSENGGAPRSHK